MPNLPLLTVTCHGCGSVGWVASLADVGTLRLAGCRCCLLVHDHDAAANAGFVCRPVHIKAPAGFQHVALLASGA